MRIPFWSKDQFYNAHWNYYQLSNPHIIIDPQFMILVIKIPQKREKLKIILTNCTYKFRHCNLHFDQTGQKFDQNLKLSALQPLSTEQTENTVTMVEPSLPSHSETVWVFGFDKRSNSKILQSCKYKAYYKERETDFSCCRHIEKILMNSPVYECPASLETSYWVLMIDLGQASLFIA